MNDAGSSHVVAKAWPDVWRSFFDFLRHPRLPERTMPFGRQALWQVGALLAVDWTSSALFVLLYVTAEKVGLKLPTSVLDFRNPSLILVLLVVLFAPLIEEFVFRLWLRGKPLLVAIALAPWLVVAILLGARYFGLDRTAVISLLAGSLVAIAVLLVLAWRRPKTPGWYRRIFPFAFWLTTAAFALAHLSNYQASMSTLLLLMVVPQFIGGMIMGYARVTYGMWSNLSLHIARNSLAMTLVMLASS